MVNNNKLLLLFSFNFCAAYPTKGCREPGVYLRSLRAHVRGHKGQTRTI